MQKEINFFQRTCTSTCTDMQISGKGGGHICPPSPGGKKGKKNLLIKKLNKD